MYLRNTLIWSRRIFQHTIYALIECTSWLTFSASSYKQFGNSHELESICEMEKAKSETKRKRQNKQHRFAFLFMGKGFKMQIYTPVRGTHTSMLKMSAEIKTDSILNSYKRETSFGEGDSDGLFNEFKEEKKATCNFSNGFTMTKKTAFKNLAEIRIHERCWKETKCLNKLLWFAVCSKMNYNQTTLNWLSWFFTCLIDLSHA